MANSIKTTLKTEWIENGTLETQQPNKQYTVETTSDLKRENTQVVGTSHELIDIGDCTDDCYVRIENKHATALVQVGHDVSSSFVGLIDIPAGGPPAIIPIATTLATTYIVSDTASTPVRITLIKIA